MFGNSVTPAVKPLTRSDDGRGVGVRGLDVDLALLADHLGQLLGHLLAAEVVVGPDVGEGKAEWSLALE